MNEQMYKEKKNDYEDLFESFHMILEKFQNYSEKDQKELDGIIEKAIMNSKDIPGAEKMFRLTKGYVIHRAKEYAEFRMRRENAENTFFQALPGIMDSIVIPQDDSCEKIASAVETYAVENNFQKLVKAMISEICAL